MNDGREYISFRIKLLRDINNLKNALQMFSEYIARLEEDELDGVAKEEGELVQSLCDTVTISISELHIFCK